MYTEFLEAPFYELKNRGADCINDIPEEDILCGLRNKYLFAAKDLIANPDRAWEEREIGLAFCEAAEKIQEIIEILALYEPYEY